MNVVDNYALHKTGQVDYVKDGKLHRGNNPPSIMVTAQSDLAQLPDVYPPGTIAYTAGFVSVWQLAANGSWVSMT